MKAAGGCPPALTPANCALPATIPGAADVCTPPRTPWGVSAWTGTRCAAMWRSTRCVYAGSAMGQARTAPAPGHAESALPGAADKLKFCPLGFAEMPADFVNAYVLGSLGATGASLGACASFLYNLRRGSRTSARARARWFCRRREAPITRKSWRVQRHGALATDWGLRQLDGVDDEREPDHRRACRPFAENCGFTIAGSAQMVVLFDDELALQLGATVLGAATDVFVNADGYKKSISGPGVGNYITMAKAVAQAGRWWVRAPCAAAWSWPTVPATPQNRTSESAILSPDRRGIRYRQLARGGGQRATWGIHRHRRRRPAVAAPRWASGSAVSCRHHHHRWYRRRCQPGAPVVHASTARWTQASSTTPSSIPDLAAITPRPPCLSPLATTRMLQQRYSKPWQAWQGANGR